MTTTHDRKGRRQHLWINPVLEDVSTRLSPNTVDARRDVSRTNRMALVRTCDYAITLHNHTRDLELAWLIFWAKYMGDPVAYAALKEHTVRRVAQETGKCKRAVLIARFLLGVYCNGNPLSGRYAERTLRICRKRTWPKLRRVVVDIMADYWSMEEQLGDRVRPLLR